MPQALDENQTAVQLPRWKCHKEVWADKIVGIRETQIGKCWDLLCGGIVPATKVEEITKRSTPVVGDYYVQYDDGYGSWSPAKAFEDGYTRVT